jgi:hypothetical protein
MHWIAMLRAEVWLRVDIADPLLLAVVVDYTAIMHDGNGKANGVQKILPESLEWKMEGNG